MEEFLVFLVFLDEVFWEKRPITVDGFREVNGS